MRHCSLPHLAVALAALLSSTLVQAQDKVCLIEGSFTLEGKTTQTRGCWRNDGLGAEAFKEVCKSTADATSGLPGSPPAKVTYPNACPADTQGLCENLGGQKLTGYYYGLDAETLARTKKSCETYQGKFKTPR